MTAPLQGAAAAMHQKARAELAAVILGRTATDAADRILELLQSDRTVTGDLIRVGAFIAAADTAEESLSAAFKRETVQQWLLMNADVLIGRNLTPDDL